LPPEVLVLVPLMLLPGVPTVPVESCIPTVTRLPFALLWFVDDDIVLKTNSTLSEVSYR